MFRSSNDEKHDAEANTNSTSETEVSVTVDKDADQDKDADEKTSGALEPDNDSGDESTPDKPVEPSSGSSTSDTLPRPPAPPASTPTTVPALPSGPQVTSLTASPVNCPDTVTLTWQSENATGVEISIAYPGGLYDSGPANGSMEVPGPCGGDSQTYYVVAVAGNGDRQTRTLTLP